MLMEYQITLKSGVTRTVTRDEVPNKSVIGLFNWANKSRKAILIDFNECVVRSEDISMIDRPVPIQGDAAVAEPVTTVQGDEDNA